MATFSLSVEYLTGYAVATDPASRERPEWPPHPARVYMALAAAHFETIGVIEQKLGERDALEWLASLEPPAIALPEASPRDVLITYVPVNDQTGGEALVQRSRQPRTFPRVFVGDEPVRFVWSAEETGIAAHREFIKCLCREVSRLGHSSSLVWMRMEEESENTIPTLVPEVGATQHRLRVATEGMLGRLERVFNQDAIQAYAGLVEQIKAKATGKRTLKEELQKRFPQGKPFSQRPVCSFHHGYRETLSDTLVALPSVFDPNFIVLREAENTPQRYGLESTMLIADALRGLILKQFGKFGAPSWVSGHEPNGDKLTSESHLALIPLPFVGSEQADGHLMGFGICVPRSVPSRERAMTLAPILFDAEKNVPKQLRLTLGKAGAWIFERDTDNSPMSSLRTSAYSGPNRVWASVTPVVLDRMPKPDRVKDPIGWRQDVGEIVRRSCTNVGLPEPIAVRIEKDPFFLGSRRAMPGAGGFPQLRKDKFQAHVAIEFDREVAGPVLLGAGRFRGYGLMRPWRNEE